MSILDDVKGAAQGAIQTAMRKAVEIAPDSLMPGGRPDPLIERKHGLIGRQISRIDGPLKVKGAAPFAAEIPMDRLCYAALAYSTIAKGRLASLDTAAAEAAPGVVLVMTFLNAPRIKPLPFLFSTPDAVAPDDLPVMQDDRIHWNGQPIALVLAETQEEADHAASLIAATYASEPALITLAEGEAQGRAPAQFMGSPLKVEIGDAEAALAAAPFKVDAAYSTPRHNHNAIEPHAVTLAWQGDTLIMHDCTQGVTHLAKAMAEAFGLTEDQVHVTAPFVGGGFGGKYLWQHQLLAAAAARRAQRPVRMALSREGVHRVCGGRTFTRQRVAIGARADGGFDALIHEGVVAQTAHTNMPEPFISPSQTSYAAGSYKLSVETVDLDFLANTFMRAPGEGVGSFALESAVDELADAIGIDPIELRVRNEPDKDPIAGTPFSARNVVEAYRAGAERFGWSKRTTPGSRREGDWLFGMGVATAGYPYMRMPGGAARITLRPDGARVEVAAHEMGMGTATTTAIVAAERLGLPLDQISVGYGDSLIPGMIIAGGSQQTASIGAAVMAAHAALVKELIKLAGNDSPLAGLSPEELESRDGGLASVSEPERFESYASILARAARNEVSVDAEAPPPLEAMHWSMHSYGAVFCEVRVNAITGETRVMRVLGSYDCGRILNPKTARSQFRGGIIMGLGAALMEETVVDDRNGRIVSASLAEYHFPSHLDVPEIDVIWTDIPDPRAPMGARGVGEIGITGVAAAVANAVYNATGKRVRELPITLDKLM